MRLSIMLTFVLFTSFFSVYSQKQPVTPKQSDLEKYSVLIPKLIKAGYVIKKSLAVEGTSDLQIGNGVLYGPNCWFTSNLMLDLEPEDGTQWEINTTSTKVQLKWRMQPETAAGSSGYYVVGYDQDAQRFDHQVSLSGADVDINTLHWQNVLVTLLKGADIFEQKSKAHKRPSTFAFELSDYTGVSFEPECRGRTIYGWENATGAHVIWSWGMSGFLDSQEFNFQWSLPEKTCVNNKPCQGLVTVQLISSQWELPVVVDSVNIMLTP